jgi:branched-subunit amino acid transport protein
MDAALKLWLVIGAVGLLNYLSRLSFIAIFAQRTIPPWLVRALRYVPAAMLTALIVPMIVAPSLQAVGPVDADLRVLAALVAGAVAFTSGSTLKTLVAGMGTLWLLQMLLPHLA